MTPEIHMNGKLAPRSSWGAPEACPIARTFETVGTRSAYVILREAFYGATRFEEFVERTEISEPVVAGRLRELTAAGLLEKFPYREPGQRGRSGYRLTEMGSEMLPVLVAMMRWGNRWLFPEGRRVDLTHSGCGSPVEAVLRCEQGHEVAPDEIDLTLSRRSPGAA